MPDHGPQGVVEDDLWNFCTRKWHGTLNFFSWTHDPKHTLAMAEGFGFNGEKQLEQTTWNVSVALRSKTVGKSMRDCADCLDEQKTHFFKERRLNVRQKCLSPCRLTKHSHAANPAWRWSASTSHERGVSPSDPCAHLRPRRHVATAFAAAQERMAPHLILQACSALLCRRRGSRRAFAFAN